MIARIPANAIPGVLVLPYWQAKYFTNNGLVDVRAIVWHFAQGGNTDSWLLHPTNDNSSNLILKYSGAVRQMVEFTDAAHSLHIDMSGHYTDYGIFSLAAAQKALGAGIRDPNAYIVTIEVEGFAADGPNDYQKRTIPLLARYLEGLFPNAVHLGHRDFQNYKACPGPTLFRGLLPHGGRLTTAGEDMADYQTIITTLPYGGRYVIPAGRQVTAIQLGPTGVAATKVWTARDAPSAASYDATVITNKTRGNPFIRATDGFFAGWLISAGQVDEVPNTAPATTPDDTPFSQAQLDAAVATATAAYKASIEAERADDTAAADQLASIAETLRLNR